MLTLGKFIFPYCIQKVEGTKNEYIVLNRNYKPVGFHINGYVKLETFPVQYKLKITPLAASKISFNGSTSLEKIYLYDDSTNPFAKTSNMEEYLERLKLLSKIKFEEVEESRKPWYTVYGNKFHKED